MFVGSRSWYNVCSSPILGGDTVIGVAVFNVLHCSCGCVQTGLEAAQEVGRGLKGQQKEAHRDCAALQAALREEEAEAKSLRGSLAEQQAQAAQLEDTLEATEVRVRALV